MSAAAAIACISEPVSWLALEQYALAELDRGTTTRVRDHLDACAACRGAFGRIRDDRRVLPALPALPASRSARAARAATPWWRRWTWAGGLGVAIAAAAILLLVIARGGGDGGVPGRRVRVKGGELVLTLVRDRAGAIAFDPADVDPADRWKVQVTCPPGATSSWIDVAVYQPGQPTSFPLPVQAVACGNSIAVPGAFRITGGGATVCVAVSATPVDRARIANRPGSGMACARLVAAGI